MNLRAAKALLIIVPLLGITYLVTIVGPSEPDTPLETVFIMGRNILLSFQGFFITLPYCFFNGEVFSTVKKHWVRWRYVRDISSGANSKRNSISIQGLNSVRKTMHECRFSMKSQPLKISNFDYRKPLDGSLELQSSVDVLAKTKI